jgi:hypothetical protein
VIVKYAEIVLTPEKPEYKGGVWHVEGTANEHIVASMVAYLQSENVSESRLHFRTMVNAPPYEQSGTNLLEYWRCMPVECSYACAYLAAWMNVIG